MVLRQLRLVQAFMLVLSSSCPRHHITFSGGLLCAAVLLAFGWVGPVQASDAELQAALQRADCGSPTIKQLFQRGDIIAYEANCFGSSHRVVTVTCTKTICHVDEPAQDEERGR